MRLADQIELVAFLRDETSRVECGCFYGLELLVLPQRPSQCDQTIRLFRRATGLLVNFQSFFRPLYPSLGEAQGSIYIRQVQQCLGNDIVNPRLFYEF